MPKRQKEKVRHPETRSRPEGMTKAASRKQTKKAKSSHIPPATRSLILPGIPPPPSLTAAGATSQQWQSLNQLYPYSTPPRRRSPRSDAGDGGAEWLSEVNIRKNLQFWEGLGGQGVPGIIPLDPIALSPSKRRRGRSSSKSPLAGNVKANRKGSKQETRTNGD